MREEGLCPTRELEGYCELVVAAAAMGVGLPAQEGPPASSPNRSPGRRTHGLRFDVRVLGLAPAVRPPSLLLVRRHREPKGKVEKRG